MCRNENLQCVFTKIVKSEESVHTNEIELEVPKVNVVEVKELPRTIHLEKPTEQDKPKLHIKQKKVLTSRVVRRPNSTKLVKRETCRPLQNHLIH